MSKVEIKWSELEPGDGISYVAPNGNEIFSIVQAFVSDNEIKVMNMGHVDRRRFSHGDLALIASGKYAKQVGKNLRVVRDDKSHKFFLDEDVFAGVLSEIQSQKDETANAGKALANVFAALKPIQARIAGLEEDPETSNEVIANEHAVFLSAMKPLAKLPASTQAQALSVFLAVYGPWEKLYLSRLDSLGLARVLLKK